MKPISVIIPTANQPEFLETALQSVARQSAVAQIEEVVVSENLLNRESEQVCKRFSGLPIRYIFQDPPLTQVQHFKYLYTCPNTDFIALLCDDDWWGTGHVQGAIQALTANSDAVAWSSNCLHASGETPWTGSIPRSPILWILAGRPTVCETWRLATPQVLAAAWIQTPFHASALVMRRSALFQVVSDFDDLHPYQDDRRLQVRLATLGMILYDPSIGTYVRAHPDALTWQFSKAEREAEFQKCTTWIWELCEKRGIDLVSIWQRSLRNLTATIKEDVGTVFRLALKEEQLRTYGFDELLLPHPLVRMIKRVRSIVKNRWALYKPIACKSIGLARRRAANRL
jgi:glycosyltransferase involved in cell wall biosynthesis